MTNHKFLNLQFAHHKILLWIIALIITLSSAVYQRLTGPTYPIRDQATIEDIAIPFKLLRSQTVDKEVPIILSVPDTTIGGYVQFVRYKSNDDWSKIPFHREDDKLVAYLSQQPPAGKLMYYVYLEKDDQKISLTEKEPVILRYKGNVPAMILIPHVLLMFIAMLLSNRTALEALDARGKAYKYMLWTIGLFFIGGLILGPLVQEYAFGAFWTGVPFGIDLTDNKTLIAMLGWIWAWFKNRKGKDERGWIVFAAILMLVVYLIPHSLLGSEIDYTKIPESH